MITAANAASMIKKNGETVEFAIITSSGVDENGDPVTTSTTLSASGCPFSYTAKEIDGTSILGTDINLLCTVSQRPEIGWKCTVDGKTYRVMPRVVPIRHGGQDIAYSCQLRV